MPLFELEGGQRAEPVATMRPDDASFGDVLSVVLDHLPALLGERLFMTLPGTSVPDALSRGEATVLAIDAAGDPVVVQAVPLLAGAQLLVALGSAGQATSTTRGSLAAAYAPGPDHFHHDLAAFFDRDGVPRATGTGRSARLVLVCAEIADDAVDAVSFVSADAGRVQVLTVGTVEGPSGRALLDVSVLRPGEVAARRTVSIDLDSAAGRPGPHTAARSAVTPTTSSATLPAFGRTDPAGAVRRPPPRTPAGHDHHPVRTADPTDVRRSRPAASPDRTAPPISPTVSTSRPAVAPAVSPAVPPGVVDDVYVPVFLDLPEALDALPERPGDLPQLPDLGSVRVPRGVDLSLPAPALAPIPQRASGSTLVAEPPARAVAATVRPTPAPSAASSASTALSASTASSATSISSATSASSPGPAHVRLGLLAQTLTAPVDLVWVRHRRGERFAVVLGLDGLLSAPDGARFTDPDHAARTLSGAESCNGWRMWRAGEHGPSLDELAPQA